MTRAGADDPRVARALGRYGMLLGVAVGVTWGPMLARLVFRVLSAGGAVAALLCVGATLAVGALGARAPDGWYRLRSWERAGGGRAYERYAAIRAFKRWMSDGDRMNARLRRHAPGYRVVRPSHASIAAYARRTREIERAHLAWLLGALPPLGYGLAVGAHGWAALWTLLNLVTNVWPILLQRYNRARVEHVTVRAAHREWRSPTTVADSREPRAP